MTLPHTLKRIRLNLARSKEFPSGSSRHGYELLAPLDEFGRIDPQLWCRYQDHCRVRRFWQGEEDQIACLVHRREGRSTLAGYSVMIPKGGGSMTKWAIVSERTSLRSANFQVTSVQPAS